MVGRVRGKAVDTLYSAVVFSLIRAAFNIARARSAGPYIVERVAAFALEGLRSSPN